MLQNVTLMWGSTLQRLKQQLQARIDSSTFASLREDLLLFWCILSEKVWDEVLVKRKRRTFAFAL